MTVLNFIKICLAFATAALIVGTGTVAGLFWHFSHGLPDHKQLADYQPATLTRLYAADGKLLAEYARDGIANRVRAFNASGVLLPGFPKELPLGTGMVPAIGDLRNDGRNLIVLGSNQWDGQSGMKDAVWVYDLGGDTHGPILWGQLGGDARHRGVYPVPP